MWTCAGRGVQLDIVQRKDAADERGIEQEVHAREAGGGRLAHVDVVRAALERDRVDRRLFLGLNDRRLVLQPVDDLLLERRIVADRRASMRALREDDALVVVRDDHAVVALDRLVGVGRGQKRRRSGLGRAFLVASLPALLLEIRLHGAEEDLFLRGTAGISGGSAVAAAGAAARVAGAPGAISERIRGVIGARHDGAGQRDREPDGKCGERNRGDIRHCRFLASGREEAGPGPGRSVA